MAEPKDRVTFAIANAQADLRVALAELEKIPAFDPGSVAFVGHALTNYLSVVGGTVELIQMHLANHPDPDVRTWLEGVQHATHLMTRTVGQLMKLTANTEAQARFEKFDLPTLVQRACTFYQRVANRKTIQVIVEPAVNIPSAWADRVLVAAVLDNLLSNAVKYSPPDKTIWVQVRGDDGCVVCSVRDEGPGLSEDDQTQLFQRGVKLTPKPTGDEPSTGYGLAVAYELIRKLGGRIWCQSTLGQGATFSFSLPVYRLPSLDQKPEKRAEQAVASSRNGG